MLEAKGVGKRRTKLLDVLRNKRNYWEIKEEVQDRKSLKRQFIPRTKGRNKNYHTQVHTPADRQHTYL